MEVTLQSNIPHYHYLAQALERAGWLKRYITSVAISERGRVSRRLPEFWRQKLEGRRIPGVDMARVSRICVPEIMQRLLPRLGLTSSERADWINNHWFDLLATRSVPRCDFFHFVNSVGLYSARKARALGAKIVCDVRQEHPRFQKRILEAEQERRGVTQAIPGSSFESRALAEFDEADYLIVPSGYARETFIGEGYPAERIFVVPYGVDMRHFRTAPKEDERFRVLFVGHLNLRKGVLDLLEAVRLLRIPDAEVVLIGRIDPDIAHLLAPYRDLFRHLPSVPKTELHRYYSNSSVFVLPSLADVYALVVTEAMACGLPVIISENTGAKEVMSNGTEGFVVPVRDPAAIADRLSRLHADARLRADMGRAAQERARRLTWESYGERAVEVYGTLGSRIAQPAEAVSLGC